MARNLVITGTASGNATLVGSWELRAGSHDTTEWLGGQGAAYVHSDTADATTGYPGSLTPFGASNTGGAAQGYDPAPKMALITLGSTTNGQTIILDEDGVDVTVLLALVSGGTAANAQTIGATYATNTVTLPTTGTVTTGQLMVLYK